MPAVQPYMRFAGLLLIWVCLTLSAGAETLSLAEAVAAAAGRHPDLTAADQQVKVQEYSVLGAKATRFPNLTGSSSYNRSGTDGQAGSQNVIREGIVENFGVSVNLRQRLYDFGRTRHTVNAAEGRLLATLADREETLQQLILTVAESYYSALREAQSVEINKANLANAENQLRQAEGFLEAGTRAKIEVVRAQADVANARVGLIQAENAKKKALVALAQAIGLAEPDPEWELAFEALPIPDERVEVTRQAMERRPTLLALQARVGAAESDVSAARAEYYPQLSASSSYSWSDVRFFPDQTRWNVGLNLEFPIFNEPLLTSQIGRASAGLEALKAQQDSLENQISREVAEAWLNLDESQQRFEATEIAERAAEESFRLATERYRVGVGNTVEVSDAQRLLVQARAQRLQARFDVQLAVARLYRALGRLGLEVFS